MSEDTRTATWRRPSLLCGIHTVRGVAAPVSHRLWGVHAKWNGVSIIRTLDHLSLSVSFGWVHAVEYMKVTGMGDVILLSGLISRFSIWGTVWLLQMILMCCAAYPWLLSDFRRRCSRQFWASSGSPQANTSVSVTSPPMCFSVVRASTPKY